MVGCNCDAKQPNMHTEASDNIRHLGFEVIVIDSCEYIRGYRKLAHKGNYEPSNCRWVTYKQQANNTSSNVSITFNGETHTLAIRGDILGIQSQTLYYRINKAKWSIEKALTTPVKIYKRN